MRAPECELTSVGRDAALQALVSTGLETRIRQISEQNGVLEIWQIGPRFRYSWCHLKRAAGQDNWHLSFGWTLFWDPARISSVIENIVNNQAGCRWIWPEPNKENNA
jgi:hypothetical protein